MKKIIDLTGTFPFEPIICGRPKGMSYAEYRKHMRDQNKAIKKYLH